MHFQLSERMFCGQPAYFQPRRSLGGEFWQQLSACDICGLIWNMYFLLGGCTGAPSGGRFFHFVCLFVVCCFVRFFVSPPFYYYYVSFFKLIYFLRYLFYFWDFSFFFVVFLVWGCFLFFLGGASACPVQPPISYNEIVTTRHLFLQGIRGGGSPRGRGLWSIHEAEGLPSGVLPLHHLDKPKVRSRRGCRPSGPPRIGGCTGAPSGVRSFFLFCCCCCCCCFLLLIIIYFSFSIFLLYIFLFRFRYIYIYISKTYIFLFFLCFFSLGGFGCVFLGGAGSPVQPPIPAKIQNWSDSKGGPPRDSQIFFSECEREDIIQNGNMYIQ